MTVGDEAFEEGDVEDRMDPHGRGEVQTEGSIADLLADFERTELAGIELVGFASGLDVSTQKPYLIAFFEFGCWKAFLVRPEDMPRVCQANIFLCLFLGFSDLDKAVVIIR